MSDPVFLTIEQVKTLHRIALHPYSGQDGVRDAATLMVTLGERFDQVVAQHTCRGLRSKGQQPPSAGLGAFVGDFVYLAGQPSRILG